jgi:hypothetical protein
MENLWRYMRLQYLFLPPNCSPSLLFPGLLFKVPIPPAMPEVEYLGMFPKLYDGAPSVPTYPPMPEEYLYDPPIAGTD